MAFKLLWRLATWGAPNPDCGPATEAFLLVRSDPFCRGVLRTGEKGGEGAQLVPAPPVP